MERRLQAPSCCLICVRVFGFANASMTGKQQKRPVPTHLLAALGGRPRLVLAAAAAAGCRHHLGSQLRGGKEAGDGAIETDYGQS